MIKQLWTDPLDTLMRHEGVAAIASRLEHHGGPEVRDDSEVLGPRLLFTDIRFPGPLSGWDIAERCRESHPKIPVIYATGFSDEEARPVPGSVLLQKPYKAAQLISTIRRLTPERLTRR
jgi:CheY-like chemotaxis protein